jgi:tetratricopeptide (TPR) repeat protein
MRPSLVLPLAMVLAVAGCHRKEITKLERDEAANIVSEADFAVTLREWSRAEGLYARAAQLCPDSGSTWFNLGLTRMRQNNHSGAKAAYKSALADYEDDSAREPSNAQAVIRRAYVLVILGRPDDARSVIAKARSKNPDDRTLRSFTENNSLDSMIADPGLKSISP